LLGYGAQKPTDKAASNNPPATPAPTFSLNTPVEHIAADPRGTMILNHDVPGLMASRSYLLFEDMSLSQIAIVSGGRLTKTKLDALQADFAQLFATGESEQ
jgi:hypothetical protein